MAQQKKPRKVGRPKLPKGEAKGRIVPVRFTPDETKAIEAAARASKQTVSEWIQSMLNAAADVRKEVTSFRMNQQNALASLIHGQQSTTFAVYSPRNAETLAEGHFMCETKKNARPLVERAGYNQPKSKNF